MLDVKNEIMMLNSTLYELAKSKKIAQEIKDTLAPHCIKCEIAGSIRRQKKMVKDIEIVCIPKAQGKRRASSWCSIVYNLGTIKKGKLKDGKYIQIRLSSGIKLDLFIGEPTNWGMLYLIRTGSSRFSQSMLYRFNKLGYHSEGNYPTKGKEKLSFETEQAIFDFLKIPFVSPEKRL